MITVALARRQFGSCYPGNHCQSRMRLLTIKEGQGHSEQSLYAIANLECEFCSACIIMAWVVTTENAYLHDPAL